MRNFVVFILLLIPSVVNATTRYVIPGAGATGCANAAATYNAATNSCPSGSSTVYTSISNAMAAHTTVAGDTLYIRAGTYGETIGNPTNFVPRGTSWANAVTVAGYPSEIITINPASTEATVVLTPGDQYIIFDNLVLDGANGVNFVVSLWGDSRTRFQNCTVRNSLKSGILVSVGPAGPGSGGFNEFINMEIHHNGGDINLDHGAYISTDNNTVERSHIYSNAAFGVQVYDGSGNNPHHNIIKNNRLHNNGRGGAVLGTGDSTLMFNNMVYDNARGIWICCGANTNKIYNNTLYLNGSFFGIRVEDGIGHIVRNNILLENNLNEDYVVGVTSGQNVSSNTTSVSTATFVDKAARDLHLKSTSPSVIDLGQDLRQDFSTDYDGNGRPQGAGWDIGADELLAPPSNFTVVIPNGGESWQVGVIKTITWSSVISGGNSSQTFSTTGSWTAPAGVTSVTVDAWGGGGGGGGNSTTAQGGGGGGGGAFARKVVTVSPSTSYTVTVGAGGAGGVQANGSAGGDSWVSTS